MVFAFDDDSSRGLPGGSTLPGKLLGRGCRRERTADPRCAHDGRPTYRLGDTPILRMGFHVIAPLAFGPVMPVAD